jgi:peptide-N4-(N-acetyl-beta-glucosaminyl)asparagine amidase
VQEDLESLLKWFREFMSWIPDQLVCSNCNADNDSNQASFMEAKVQTGNSWRVQKKEIHTCNICDAQKIFPRYNDALQIAKSRNGRCGEWSILFGAILNSVSLESRIANDYLDHCWNEVFLDGKWFHVDSTFQYPDSFNNPYYYERNWKKQYVYVLAFSSDNLEDVTARYTEQLDTVLSRRKGLGQLGSINVCSITDLQNLYSSIKSEYDGNALINV